MDKFLPNVYKKDIYSIDYEKLKSMGIKLIIFDFDNTITPKDGNYPSDRMIDFFNNLKKSFDVIVISNTLKSKKISKFCDVLSLKYVMNARKPFIRGYKQINKIQKYDVFQVAAVGDQLLTDVLGANKMGYLSILVDPIGIDDTKFTKINRFIEIILYKRLKNEFNFERGKYYD